MDVKHARWLRNVGAGTFRLVFPVPPLTYLVGTFKYVYSVLYGTKHNVI